MPLCNLSVGMSVRVCDIEFVVFTDWDSCTRHKPGIYGSGRVWANAWDVFFRAPSRGGRGRRAAAAFVVCSGWGGFFRVFLMFRLLFFFERTRPTASMRPPLASFTYLLVIIMRPFLAYRQKIIFIPGCVQGVIV